MTLSALMPVFVILSSLLTGLFIFVLPEERRRTRATLNLIGAVAKIVLVAVMLLGVWYGETYLLRAPLLPGIDFVLRGDALALLFVTLSAGLWLLTTIYAIGYLEGSPHRSRFFGFFSLCVTATMGIAFAGNLFTFFLFYEMLTLSTYPLVAHRGTPAALRAGSIYLAYTLAGGAVLLLGIVWLYALAGPVEFRQTGALSHVADVYYGQLGVIFALLIAGLGVKTALVPLHGWLPQAMVAPAPVSALLHAVAVVKAGAFGVMRVVYDIYGINFLFDLGLLQPLAYIAAFTVIYGSVRALVQDDLKRRLAYSTVSQVAHIVLGIALFGPVATLGGVVHLVHQGIMKVTLFFCAGNLAETLGIHRVSEMNGTGRRMPLTMAAFTIGAFGMIGTPPLAGFVTKWYIGLGALQSGQGWAVAVLVASGLLNAAYFLPIVYAAWFKPPPAHWPAEHPHPRHETDPQLLVPTLVTAALTVLVGVLAGAFFSPLEWVRLIIVREFLP